MNPMAAKPPLQELKALGGKAAREGDWAINNRFNKMLKITKKIAGCQRKTCCST
jgi:hypothetical protein